MKAHITPSTIILSLIFLLGAMQAPAREVYPLQRDWRVFASTEGSADRARNVDLPHFWSLERNTSVNLVSTNFLRAIFVPASWRGQRVFVKFGGVNSVADIFINGRYIAGHRGGAAFAVELTQHIDYGESNIMLVRVSSAPQNDILPTSVEHEMYGGMCGGVELIMTPQTAISPLFYGSDGLFVTTHSVAGGVAKGEVAVQCITPSQSEREVLLEVIDGAGKVLYSKSSPKVKIDGKSPLKLPFEVSGVTAWSPSTPALYRVRVQLASSDGDERNRDVVEVETGFRTISLAESGATPAVVRINDEPTLLRGVTLYHDHPHDYMLSSTEAYDSDFEFVKELGANAIRSAVVPHDRYLYSLCDRAGVMVWVDTPLSRSPYLSDIAYFPTARFEENGVQQMREIIYQNYNHPSVVMWGLFSMLSSRGDSVVGYLRELNDEAQKIDVTRPTVAVSNQNGELNSVSDLIVWRQNIGWDSGRLSDVAVWRDQIHSKWSHMRSGVIYGEGGSVDHQIDRSEIEVCRAQGREGWFPEVRQSAMHEGYMAHLSADSLFWGVWCSALFDFKAPRNNYGENVEGLVNFDRTARKDAFYLYKALWNKSEPTLHIADKRSRHIGMGEKDVTLRVYASDDATPPVAIIGEERKEMQRVAPSQFILEGVAVRGRTQVVVEQGDLRDEVEFIYGSPLRNQKR